MAWQYAPGNVSARPGLFMSGRIDAWRGPLGVVVVKSELDRSVELARERIMVFTTDEYGVFFRPACLSGVLRSLAAFKEEVEIAAIIYKCLAQRSTLSRFPVVEGTS